MNINQIFEFLNKIETISLATLERNHPRVRLMALIKYNNKYWCCTKTSRPKIEQIKNNNLFEFCSKIEDGEKFGSIRASGRIKLIEDLEVKKELSGVISFFNAFWKSYDEPNFSLLQLDIEKIEIHNPYDKKFYSYNFEKTIEVLNKN